MMASERTPPSPAARLEPTRAAPPGFTTGTYVRSFVGLVCLTVLSFGLSFAHLGAFGMPVALAIAAVKVGVVALFFMGLKHDLPSHRLAGVAALLFIALLASLSAIDVLNRP